MTVRKTTKTTKQTPANRPQTRRAASSARPQTRAANTATRGKANTRKRSS